MMTDNQITIYLDSKAHESIIRDQKLFKTGGNKSRIIKKIIINHYAKYEKDINELKQKIKNTIIEENENHGFKEEAYLNIAWKITKHISEKPIKIRNMKNQPKDKIHIRRNKHDSELDFILDSRPMDASESEYLANIIYSYLNEPQYERERIIYKDIMNIINEAIHNNQSIRIKTNADKNSMKNYKIKNINPKEICASMEGLYNYLIYQAQSEKTKEYYASTIHIYNIIDVHPDLNPSIFYSNIEKQILKMKKNGIQFSINGDTVYAVRLTEKGRFLFESRYLERPVALAKSDKDKGIYYFDCSEMQFKSYFAPFRKEAIVLSPKEMRDEIIKEYKSALHDYEEGLQ